MPFARAAEPERFDLIGFSVARPPDADWRVMTRGPDSIWFHRAVSPDEFSMIAAMAIKIEKSQWGLEDRPLADAIIREYRQSTAESGHQVEDETFSVETVNGLVFFADKAALPAVHAQPIDPSFLAREEVYVHIEPHAPSEEPHLYFFVFTDVRRREVPYETNLREFMSVLESLRFDRSGGSG